MIDRKRREIKKELEILQNIGILMQFFNIHGDFDVHRMSKSAQQGRANHFQAQFSTCRFSTISL